MAELEVTIVAHDVAGAGGMERQLRALITGLLARGHAVTVVSRTCDLPSHERLFWRRVAGPSRPFVIAYPWFALLGSLVVARQRRGVLHTTGAIVINRADVCTLHLLHSGAGGQVLRARRRSLLYQLNDRIGRVMARSFERLVIDGPLRARSLVSVSESLAVEVAAEFPSRADEVLVIRNGVDARLFAKNGDSRRAVRRWLGLEEDDFVVLFVGSEWRGKGLGVSIDALAQTDARTHLVVVGSGDIREMSSRTGALGISDRVHFVGETSAPEHFYAAADTFVLPSEYETYSIAAFEAAASGLPVLATRTGAHGQLFTAGAAVPIERDVTSVANGLTRLQGDAAVRRAMGESGRELALTLGWDATVDGYIDVYRSSRAIRPSVKAPGYRT
jgi:UDP-glucose:(heptosyl)LPS alpha-1,3-glucosyltransferase